MAELIAGEIQQGTANGWPWRHWRPFSRGRSWSPTLTHRDSMRKPFRLRDPSWKQDQLPDWEWFTIDMNVQVKTRKIIRSFKIRNININFNVFDHISNIHSVVSQHQQFLPFKYPDLKQNFTTFVRALLRPNLEHSLWDGLIQNGSALFEGKQTKHPAKNDCHNMLPHKFLLIVE